MTGSGEVQIGTELLGYRVEELIGRGGMGVVYRATDLRLKRQVALKLLSPELARDEGFRRRFLTESELAASLDHPHILPVYSAGEANGVLYIATRYVEDSDLRRLLRAEAPLEPARALRLLGEVADALDAAHERGLVHRDVKPSNILISVQAGAEHSYLADFGLAQRTGDLAPGRAAAQVVGTVDYVAPEQVERDDVDPRADVYGLGCVLYECLTGEVPFPRDSDLAALWAHMRTDPPRVTERRPQLPEAVDAVVSKALAKDPQKRYASCGELVESARQALGLADVRVVRGRLPLLLAAAALVASVAVAAFALGGGDRSPLALRGNSLVRIDPATNSIRAVIDVGDKPVGVAVSGRTAWVYNLGDGTVSQIDTSTNRVRRTTSVSSVPYTAKFNVGPLLAANSAGAWLVGVRPDGKGVVTRIGLDGRSREVVFERAALAVAVSETAVWVLASLNPGGFCAASPLRWSPSDNDVVLRLSPSTGRLVGRVRLPACGTITGVAADDRWVWAFEAAYSNLVRIDPRASRVTGRLDLGVGTWGPSSGVPASGGGAVWVHASDRGGRIVSVDPRTLRITGTIPSVPGRFGAMRFARRAIWWNDAFEGAILRFDPDTGKLVSSIRVAPESEQEHFHSSAIATGAGALWVTVTPSFLD